MSRQSSKSWHRERRPLLRRRLAFTLLEMLVATAASVVMLGLVMQLFAVLSDAVSTDRSIMQLDGQMRSVRSALITDLDGFTVPPGRSGATAWLQTTTAESGNGYFEYVEGPNTDTVLFEDQANGYTVANPPFDKAGLVPVPGASDDRIVGDTDDVLMLTTQSFADPYAGKAGGQPIDSDYAEVAWFCVPTPGTANPVTYTLYRRQLLVMGYVNAEPFASGQQQLPYSDWATYLESYDVSCRREYISALNSSYLFVNSLQDLSKRENRMLHDTADVSLPNGTVNRAGMRVPPLATSSPRYPFYSRVGRSVSESIFDPTSSARGGDDVMMTNVIAFDARAFDARLVYKNNVSIQLKPSDPGYWVINPGSNLANWNVRGGAADLFYKRTKGTASPVQWHLSSECYGVGANPLLNRVDNNSGLVDDVFDSCPWDTSNGGNQLAPHDRIEGLEITLRVFDPKTKRVRQLTFTWVPS